MCTDPNILRELLNAGADVNSQKSGGDPFDRDGGSRTKAKKTLLNTVNFRIRSKFNLLYVILLI